MTDKERELLYAIGEGVAQLLYDTKNNDHAFIIEGRITAVKAEQSVGLFPVPDPTGGLG